MPTYDYRCRQCGHSFEARHSIDACAPPCPSCGGTADKVILSAPAVHGYMAQGRELAVRSLEPREAHPSHGIGCPCCRHP